MNLPNLITIGRFFFIPLFILTFFSYNSNLYAFLVLIAAGFSDMLDGYLARKNGQVTEIGKLLDPLADKLMMITVILAFVIDERISWWAASIIFLRDIGMILISAFFHFNGRRQVPAANIFGKATTVLFYFAILLIMFEWPYHHEFFWGTILFSLITSGIYFIIFIKLNTSMKRASQ